MVTTNYSCAQADLYNAGRIFWRLYATKLSSFSEFSPMYTDALAEERLADIEAADLMPDKAARESTAGNVLLSLETSKKDFLYQYGLLQGYIARIFEGTKRDLMLASSGEGYLAKAKSGNWGSTASLISSVVLFMTEKQAELAAANIMPLAFPDKIKATAKTLSDKYAAWDAAKQAVTEGGDAKIKANNAIYEGIKMVCQDAKKIFANDATTAKTFVWATILDKTHGTRNAGVGGKITNGDNKTGVAEVRIRILNTDKVMMTDSEGRFEIAPLSMGSYTAVVEKEGYESLTVPFEIKTGVMTRLNGSLKLAA